MLELLASQYVCAHLQLGRTNADLPSVMSREVVE
jgi:hypothetical protein